MVNITFDRSRCVKCGQCVRICPASHLHMTDAGPEAAAVGCMGCLHCAAICPQDAVLNNGGRATVAEPFDTVEALVMSRRSVRRYKTEPPDKKTLQWALDRAGHAPSGGNRRPTRWTVVHGPEQMAAVKEAALQFCRDTGNDLAERLETGMDVLTCGATALIVAWEPAEMLNPGTDAVIALTTAELLLAGRGLGTCWGGYMRRIIDGCPALRAMLGIPEGGVVCGCLMVGRPAVTFSNIPARQPADITWLE